MFDLVDIHCHALSCVDDGAGDEETMKSMLDTAYSDGIRAICFTPHFKIFEFDSDEDIEQYNHLVSSSYNLACSYIKEKYPDMALYLGNEIMYHDEILNSLNSKSCKSLNGSSYILVEFQPTVTTFDIENAVIRILRKGYIPIIAHIERYSALLKKPELIYELRSMGALMQINARGILKFKFGRMARFIKDVLRKKQVDIVASDAHDNSIFAPNLSKAMLYVSKHYGEKYAEKIFSKVPYAVLSNKKNH